MPKNKPNDNSVARKWLSSLNSYKELIFGYSSFIGLVLSLFYTGYAFYENKWDMTSKLAVTMLAFLTSALAYSAIYSIRMYHILGRAFAKRETDFRISENEARRREQAQGISLQESGRELLAAKKKQEVIAGTIHNILHESRILVNRIHTEQTRLLDVVNSVGSTGNIGAELDMGALKKTFELFMLYLLDNLKTSFDILTGDVCSVCMKFIVVSERSRRSEVPLISDKDSLKDVCVRTYMRDCSSYRARSVTDERIRQFPYYENVAFKKILEPHHPDSWFLCNNLKEMSGGYVNYRVDWRQDYNACLVVPIRTPVNGGYSVIGFLCVDNFAGNFTDRVEKDFLASIGDHVFFIFRAFSDLEEMAQGLKQKEEKP